jgi:hypothetical protein
VGSSGGTSSPRHTLAPGHRPARKGGARKAQTVGPPAPQRLCWRHKRGAGAASPLPDDGLRALLLRATSGRFRRPSPDARLGRSGGASSGAPDTRALPGRARASVSAGQIDAPEAAGQPVRVPGRLVRFAAALVARRRSGSGRRTLADTSGGLRAVLFGYCSDHVGESARLGRSWQFLALAERRAL